MEHDDDNYNNRDWCFLYSHQRIDTSNGGLGNKRTSGKGSEYWEEFWRLEETCCNSNSIERPSTKTDGKNFQGVNMTRKLEGNTHQITKKDTKKDIKLENARTWWNTWILVQEIRLHSRRTSTRNEQMPTRCTSTWLDDQRKDHIDPKGPK